ncbi:MAG TPA: glycoside hydrolase domain-containing protein [Phycisphaerae bacterium]|nr:glycoside hydrolase domain-containing protein [Phycisphaerae bacterium]
MRTLGWVGLTVVSCFLAGAQAIRAAEAPKQPSAAARVVLDTASVWRMFQTLEAPVIQFDDGVRPILDRQQFLNFKSPPPPRGWTGRDFDDGTWLSGPARMASRTPLLSRLCLRGKFVVTAPNDVRGLALSVQYYGGAIVYVNGTEIARGHVPAKADLAEPYPAEAFVKNGLYVGNIGRGIVSFKPEDDNLHLRKLEHVAIPSRLLVAGVNVVSVEIVRAPYNKIIDEVKPSPRKANNDLSHQFTWYTCDLKDVRLTCGKDDGVLTSAVRPQGLQVWNGDVLACDMDQDFGNPAEALRPMTITGARNGWFSGKVVVGSTKAIQGLKVTSSALTHGRSVIPAERVQIRYGLLWGHEALTDDNYTPQELPYPGIPHALSMLAEEAPAEVPVRQVQVLGYGSSLRRPGQPTPVSGAVAPVWVSVHVPKGVEAGLYVGKITIQVTGEKPVEVPVQLNVADWTVPDPANFRTWVELMQSPDTLVQEYGVKMWSEKHFELIGRSMQQMGLTGSGVVYVPLIAHTNLGNEESMVRWIKKGNGYTFDLSVMEKYLDVAQKNLGKPKMVVFYVWDVFLLASRGPQGQAFVRYGRGRNPDQRAARADQGPPVTVLDPATGATSMVSLPPYTAPESKALWRPLFVEIRKSLARRGLAKAGMLGLFQDAWASKGEVQFFKEIAPTFPWVIHSHGNIPTDRMVFGIQKIAYDARYYQCRFADMAGNKATATGTSLFGWKQKELIARFDREHDLDSATATLWRYRCETNITGSQRGVGRIGADTWPSIKGGRGNRRGRVFNRYPESNWGGLNMVSSVLAPGPNGPVATNRFVNLQEGVQECEARIAIEKALSAPGLKRRLGDELARRAQKLLDDRLLYIIRGMSHLQLNGPVRSAGGSGLGWLGKGGVSGPNWFRGSGWQQRTADLFDLAGEVEKKMGK